MRFLIAADLEGVHGVVGEPNKVLSESTDEYERAKESATLEINSAAKALFDEGAEYVALWDNHGAKKNLDYALIDPRVEVVDAGKYSLRMGFAADLNFDAILYIGYHSREGSFNGVLAHSYSSKAIQYIKIDQKPVGELDIDSYIAGIYGIAPIFVASDDVAIGQFKELNPDAVCVITKYGKGRNAADFREREIVLTEIYDGVRKAVNAGIKPITYKFPAHVEVRHTRAERAATKYSKLADDPKYEVKYGEDSHIIHATAHDIYDVVKIF